MRHWLLAAAALAAACAPTCAQTLVPVTAWQITRPAKAYADLPALRPEVDYAADNDLQSLVFVCDRDRFHLLIVAPLFKVAATAEARLTLGEGGPTLALPLRDLYRGPGREAPKLNWDATVLYAPLAMEDLSQMAPLNSLSLAIGTRRWRLPLPGFEKALPVFLTYCATGRITDPSVLAD
jgi:hypothetical protein